MGCCHWFCHRWNRGSRGLAVRFDVSRSLLGWSIQDAHREASWSKAGVIWANAIRASDGRFFGAVLESVLGVRKLIQWFERFSDPGFRLPVISSCRIAWPCCGNVASASCSLARAAFWYASRLLFGKGVFSITSLIVS